MIRKFYEFVNNKSLGELIESLYDDDYIKNIVNRFINNISPDIQLSNAINLLSNNDKRDIINQIKKYKEEGILDKDVDMIISTKIEESIINEQPMAQAEISTGGKSIFTSFLKSLTALGQKDKNPNKEKCPSQFLLFYYYDKLISDDVKSVFNRFRSIERFTNMLDYTENETALYFGIKCDGTIEYGIAYERLHKIGSFKLSTSTIKWILNLDLKSISSLKKEIVNLTQQDIILLGKIKQDMKEFLPGYSNNVSKPEITDRIITFAYHGTGNWNNGKMDNEAFTAIKDKFIKYITSKKWGNKVLISVNAESFWLYLKIKIK